MKSLLARLGMILVFVIAGCGGQSSGPTAIIPPENEGAAVNSPPAEPGPSTGPNRPQGETPARVD